MSDLRRARERHPELPPIVFVHQGSLEQGEQLLAERWPEVPAIADPEQELYRAFGLERGGARQLLGPRVWLAGLRALLKGHLVGKPVGDLRQMPGLFLCRGAEVLASHVATHSGDRPGAPLLLELSRRATLP